MQFAHPIAQKAWGIGSSNNSIIVIRGLGRAHDVRYGLRPFLKANNNNQYKMNIKKIAGFIIDCIISVICWVEGHSWLTPTHGKRFCGRCDTKQKRNPSTNYKWVADIEDVVNIARPFNPID